MIPTLIYKLVQPNDEKEMLQIKVLAAHGLYGLLLVAG